jgi:hypothetical protein
MATALVHLVRNANGLAPFERFLESHRRCDPGAEHELVLLYKGFAQSSELDAYRERAAELSPREVHVSDDGVDLTAYLAAAAELEHDRVCFVNSFSRVRADGWLGALSGALDSPGVGIAGATGSWGSHRAGALLMLRLPSGLGKDFDLAEMLSALRELGGDDQPPARSRPFTVAWDLARSLALYPGFPAVHVRTNAFIIERGLLLDVVPEPIPDKDSAYRLEAGKRSLTARIERRGLSAVIVGRDGTARTSRDWAAGDIFWQADQRDLLVEDNQTVNYDRATPAQRHALCRYAWGTAARPA